MRPPNLGRFYPNRHKAVVAEDLPRVSCQVKGGTIILSRMNTKELVGESGYVREDDHELWRHVAIACGDRPPRSGSHGHRRFSGTARRLNAPDRR